MAEKAFRRKLRKEQRELHDEILDHREELENVRTKAFENVNAKNEELFHQTNHSREALQDVLNVKELVRAVKVQTSYLDDVSIRYDFNSFAAAIQNIYHKPGERKFSWEMFGKSVGVLSHRRSDFSVMLGPIDKEAKEKAVRGPRARVLDSNDPSCPDEVQHGARSDADAKSFETEATNKRIINLIHTLREGGRGAKTLPLSSFPTMNKKQSTENLNSIDLLDLLVDRTDPVQTVENFFDFAFLLKEKRAMETINPSNGLPYLVQVDPGTMKDHWGNETKQMVLTMNIPDLRTISELLVSESESNNKRKRKVSDEETRHCPLHRTDPIYVAKDIKEQIDLITENAKKHVVTSTTKKRQSTNSTSNGETISSKSNSSNITPLDDNITVEIKSETNNKKTTKKVVSQKSERRPSRNKSLQVSDDEDNGDDDDEIEDESILENKQKIKKSRRVR